MIVTSEQLPEIRRRHRFERIVFAGGVFDLIHEGHVDGLEKRRKLGDLLVVGITSDERVQERKGLNRPIRRELGRLSVVNAFRAVDYAFIMPLPAEKTPTIQVIQALQPDIFVDHHENQHRWEVDRAYIESLGTELAFDDAPKLDSTTDIISRVIDSTRFVPQPRAQ